MTTSSLPSRLARFLCACAPSHSVLARLPTLLLATALLGAVACDNGVDTLRTLRPKIGMVDCQPNGPCGVDAGGAAAFSTKLLEIPIRNSGDALLTITGVRLGDTTDPAFILVAAPQTIPPGEEEMIQIRFNPIVEGRVTGAFIIRSDASNVVCDETTDCEAIGEGVPLRDLLLTLEGTGMAGGAPSLTIDKEACAFGQVGLGASGSCTISIGNDGDGDLLIDRVQVTQGDIASGSAGDVFSVIAPDGQGVAPGTRASIDLTFYPDAVGNYSSTLRLLTNDAARPEVLVALTGSQIDAPTCQLRLAAVNNVPVNNVVEVEPLDDVILSALTSVPASDGAVIASVAWEWIERPSGSTLEFSAPGELTTGFVFADGVQGIDLAGSYRVAATVTDSFGIESTNLCEVAFNAVPSQQFLAQLGWDTPTGDMDLHLVRMDNGGFCSRFGDGVTSLASDCGDPLAANDCHFANCTLGGLDWDGSATFNSAGDPSLDIDDLCGYGPENITLPNPEPGQYLVAAHYWGPSCGGGAGPVGNTMRIFLNGVLAFEGYKELGVNEWWEAAIVYWDGPGTTPCVAAVDSPETCG